MLGFERTCNMKLNLKRDLDEIGKFIRERVSLYDEYENIGPGEDEDPIRLITVGFHVEQNAFVCVIFDTRPNADVDGEWTMFQEEDNLVYMPAWEEAFENLCDKGTVTVSLKNGKSKKLDTNDDNHSVAKFFGEQILKLVMEFNDADGFETLPLAKNAFLSIEEYGGRWGWPEYKHRKKLGRINN